MDLLFIGGVTVVEQSENPISTGARKNIRFCINPAHVLNLAHHFANIVLVLKGPVGEHSASLCYEAIYAQILNICVPKEKQKWWLAIEVASAYLSAPSKEKILTDEDAEAIQAICTQTFFFFFHR